MQEQQLAPIALAPAELRRLTLFRWTYALEARGFTAVEARRLLFQKYLYSCRLISGCRKDVAA